MDTAPHYYAKDRKAWREWLEQNHQTEKAVWLVYDKGEKRVLLWPDIVQEALCFGWIDSRPGKISETQSKIYVSKRRPKSVWSKKNKAHVETLIAQGLMMPPGLTAIRIAKENGSWDTLNDSDNLTMPKELKQLFDINPIAKNNFEAFPVSSKRNTLQWIYDAKTDSTRTKRVTQIVEAAGAEHQDEIATS